MIGFAKRNLKVFFKDKSAVFFSLLSVFIIIGLYAFFLGDTLVKNFPAIPDARFLVDSWIAAGLLAVTSVTATLGAFGIMIEDRSKNITKDFYSSPVKRSTFAAGYVFSAFLVGVIMSILALILVEYYIVINGGSILSGMQFLKVVALILLSTFSNNAMIFLLVSFFKSTNAFGTASTIIGTLIGFLTGIYVPIGGLPEAAQYVIKFFPPSHSALLFRQVMMESAMKKSFQDVPSGVSNDFREMLGVTFRLKNFTVTPLFSIAVLLGTAAVFYALAVLVISRKKH
jgi:ABC-2 type transporter.